jgi:hypothetical protein
MSLRNIILISSSAVLAVLFSGCASQPAIIRQIIPVSETNSTFVTNHASINRISKEQDGVTVGLHFIDRAELFEMLRKNKSQNQGSGGVDPVMTTFLFEIKNSRKARIKVDQKTIVLLDGLGGQFPAFDQDSFKEQYPSTFEQTTQYFFLFDKYITDPDQKSSSKSRKALFQGGYVYPGARVSGILTFDRVSELAKKISIIIPDIQYFDEKDKPDKKADFRFDFIQSIRRLGE